MTVDELVERIQARCGQLRVRGARLQYRPAGVLSPGEVDWLGHHREEVLAALTQTDQPQETSPAHPQEDVGFHHQPLGEAGPGVPAWRCSVDLGTGHVMGVREDGSIFCSTCHPGVLACHGGRPT
ncbi:MAG: hypothetical protein ACLQBX_10960 [Candidatus Limnocylindrales bacterium]